MRNTPMKDDTTILPFRQSEPITDPLTELARQGARRMLAKALKAEADAFVASFADERLDDGRQRVVRHGFGPERQIQTGIGALDVQRPKVRDRLANSDPASKSVLHRTYCRNGRGALSAWMRCYRFCI